MIIFLFRVHALNMFPTIASFSTPGIIGCIYYIENELKLLLILKKERLFLPFFS